MRLKQTIWFYLKFIDNNNLIHLNNAYKIKSEELYINILDTYLILRK